LEWWQSAGNRTSVLFCYAFGKTQRVLAELALLADKRVFLHGAAHGITRIYHDMGVHMLDTLPVSSRERRWESMRIRSYLCTRGKGILGEKVQRPL